MDTMTIQMVVWAVMLLGCLPTLKVEGLSGSGGYEIDVSWDFTDGDFGGWANATFEEMQMEVMSTNGELRCSIKDDAPKIDSPQLFLPIGSRHYVVMRMSYSGASTTAKWLLRSGSTVSGRSHRDFGNTYWAAKLDPVVVTASATTNDTLYGGDHAVDGDKYTYFLGDSPSGVYMILDLGTSRWIKELRMLPLGDANSPKTCLLQRSITMGAGPFETVVQFQVAKVSSTTSSNYTTEETHVIGFNHARYCLIVLDNHGGDSVGIRELSLHGYDEEIAVLPFDIVNMGAYQNYYVPIMTTTRSNLLRLRLELVPETDAESNARAGTTARLYREGMNIDYIRIAQAPEVWRVRGCLDRYFNESIWSRPTTTSPQLWRTEAVGTCH